MKACKKTSMRLFGVCAVVVLCASSALAQGRAATVDVGKREFEAHCASCHGVDGKGSGVLTGFLTKSPPDLTLLARKNGGVLPVARLYEVIDGAEVPAHGSREMPVWGREYRIQDAEYFMESPYNAEARVRARILTLLEYIHRMQAK